MSDPKVKEQKPVKADVPKVKKEKPEIVESDSMSQHKKFDKFK